MTLGISFAALAVLLLALTRKTTETP